MDVTPTSQPRPVVLPDAGRQLSSRARKRGMPAQTQDQGPLAQLLAALGSERPIGYNANLARAVGDAKAGLLLSQLLYWTRVGVDIESSQGWITKSRDQWSLETGLSRCEQENARLVLLDAGLIQESRIGMPSKLAFRACLPEISSALASLLKTEPVQWSLFDVRSNADQVRALLGHNMAFYRVYTEITGSVTQAIFMARAIQAQRACAHTEARSEWFTFIPDAWAIETGLTQAQLRTGKQRLCQTGYVEQAQMLYPKRRTVLRMRLHELTTAVVAQRFARMHEGKVGGGLLGAIARRPQAEGQQAAIKGPDPALQALSPAKSHQQGIDMGLLSNKGRSPNWRGVSVGHSSPIWRTMDKADAKTQEILCFADSPGLDGRISHPDTGLKQAERPFAIANLQASFDTTVGRFTQDRRQVLTALHARARLLTTENKTTPPPTPSWLDTRLNTHGTGSRLEEITDGGGGGEFHLPSEQKDKAGHQASVLIWPEHLGSAMRQAIERMVQSHSVARSLAPERLQLLLDELAAVAARGQLRSPTAYLSTLLSKEETGTLELGPAYEWQARRQAKNVAAAHLAKDESTPANQNQRLQVGAAAAQCTAAPVVDTLAQKLWEATVDLLQPAMGASHVQLWLAPLMPVSIQEGRIVLLCRSRFKLDHIKRTYLAAMEDALAQVMNSHPPHELGRLNSIQWGFRLVTSFRGH